MKYKFSSSVNQAEYDAFTKLHNSSFMQMSSWGKVKNNWVSYMCGLYNEEKLEAVCLILEKKVAFNITLFYIPRGFVIDFLNLELLKIFTNEIKKFAILHHAFCVKIDPNFAINEKSIIDDALCIYSDNSIDKHHNMIKCGYQHKGYYKELDAYLQPRFQMMVPLCNFEQKNYTEEEIKNNCKKKVSGYLGNYHEKRGVFFSKSNKIEAVDEFMEIIKLTEKRQNITLRNKEYFTNILNNFDAYLFFGKLDLYAYLAYLENEKNDLEGIKNVKELINKDHKVITLSTALVIFPQNIGKIRTSEYLYAANNLLFSKLNVSVGLVYDICKYSLEKKCNYCNLGGVNGNLNDHLSTFKSKFNSNIIEFVGEYDLIINKFLYYPINFLLPIFKKIMKIKRNIFK